MRILGHKWQMFPQIYEMHVSMLQEKKNSYNINAIGIVAERIQDLTLDGACVCACMLACVTASICTNNKSAPVFSSGVFYLWFYFQSSVSV